jgi:hypothetical protein
MKKHLLISAMFLLSIASYSQTFKSSYVNETKPKFETDTKDRMITISDKEITVTNFLDGGVKTWHLIVNKIENKDCMYDGL